APTLTVSALLGRVRDASLDAQAHQDVPFHLIVEAVKAPRSVAHTPLFQVMCNVQSWDFQARRALSSGLTLEFLTNDARAAQFDLAFDVSEVSGRLECALSYSLDLFDEPTVARMAAHFTRLIAAMVARPQARLCDLPMLSETDAGTALALSRGLPAPVTGGRLEARIARQAAATPDKRAVVFGERRLTYAALDARANQLAHRLRQLGVGPNVLVGLCVARSLELVVGVLGILKAGGGYVPLDPEYPAERLQYMATDSGIGLLLTEEKLLGALPKTRALVWCLDRNADELRGLPESAPAPQGTAEDVAYCIYTSGSTGQPKGVLNGHAGIQNRIDWMQAEYGLGAADKVLQKTPLSFDVSVGELLWPLSTGAELVVAPPGAHRDPEELGAVIRAHGVTAVDFVPSLLSAFVACGELARCTTLRLVTVGGEALSPEIAEAFLSARPDVALYNMYGPTEASVDVSYHRCAPGGEVVLGRPLSNVGLYVLDGTLSPVPVGVTGELYVSGVALARGYHGRAGLTAERFVPHPFAGQGGRLYRTGDLGRYRADGLLEFCGRGDEQVKERGYRIELGEIASVLRGHAGVQDATVSAWSSEHGKPLVGYVTTRREVDEEAFEATLRSYLSERLPEYMVPWRVLVLSALPLTANGKVDRKALPAPSARETGSYEAPSTPVEKELAQIWSDVLGVARVGVEDNFFELGGDSILSLQIVTRARAGGLGLSPKQLFQHQTVRALASVATQIAETREAQGPVAGALPLTPIQAQFFHEVMAHRDHFNQALLLMPRDVLRAPVLERALRMVCAHHDALRLRYRQSDGQVVQAYEADEGQDALLWERAVADRDELPRMIAEAQRSLSLTDGPLLRAVHLTLEDGSERLLVVIHHLVVDGVSWRILLEDLASAYEALGRGEEPVFAAKTSSFKAWADRLEAYAASAEMARELPYWLAQGERAPA
ncbi:MAG TPA: amino acid adenylation domain-containing protein, partial [Polyangiales bacterium]